MNSIAEMLIAFVEVARDLRNDFVESWLKGRVSDYEMDMALINEKKYRAKTYKRINELHSRHGVEQ